MPDRVVAYVGLGSNVGDRLGALRAAVHEMASWPDTEVGGTSAVYETEAHVLPDGAPQADHLNAVVTLRTSLGPMDLLRRLHDAERAAGRDPTARPWSPRALDLDLLLYGSQKLDSDALTLPHPRLGERRFVLQPLADVAPSLVVPRTDRTVADLLRETTDTARIVRTDAVLVSKKVPDL